MSTFFIKELIVCFKPCYKWITFNTIIGELFLIFLAIFVLNLVINGLPSILLNEFDYDMAKFCFKPCYKWITFNTELIWRATTSNKWVLNLVINGLPSILTMVV